MGEFLQLQISKQQLYGLLQAMPRQEQMEVYEHLRKSLFADRLNELLQAARTDQLSDEDITREVEAVRQARYERRRA